MSTHTIEVIDNGMRCLSDNLGAKEAEIFITTILKERFDYTEWRKKFVDSIDSFEKLDDLVDAAQNSTPFVNKANVII